MNRRDFIKTLGATAWVGRTDIARESNQSSNDRVDYIVVGAGSAGCVVVNRLTADPAVRVLLLEAGGPGDADPRLTTPARWPALVGSPWDWGDATEAEPGLQNRRLAYPHGKVFGGSSAIGAATFIRGHRMSYDRWRDLGNEGWGYDDLIPLFKRSERNESGASQFRGGDGPLSVAYCWDPHAAHKAFLAAASVNGFRADARFDFNGPSTSNAAGFFQKTILDGRRHSAAAAFLEPALARPNLEVRSHALASRVIVEGRKAVGVEYIREGRREQARASREVVVCAGAIDSPKLLMLSGIGPAAHLRAHGIAVVSDLPGVGQGLQDHPWVAVRWNGKTSLPASSVTAGICTRSSPSAESMQRPPDLQLSLGRGLDQADPFVTIAVSLVQPRSRGEIRLQSADPTARPIVRVNGLQAPADVDALVRGIRMARWFGEAEIFDELRAEEAEPGASVTSDADLAQFVHRTADLSFHAAGTCKMGPASDPMAVVEPTLHVRGVDGLRVADASIMPVIVNAPTQAASVLIGERAADLLRSPHVRA